MWNRFIFLQKTHSSLSDEKKWVDKFRGKFFFSHEKHSCRISIGYHGPKKLEIKSNNKYDFTQLPILGTLDMSGQYHQKG